MKKIFYSILFLAVSLSVFSQNCESYYPAKVGVSWEITNYDARDKVESVQKSSIISAEQSDGGILVTVEVVSYDTKDKQTANQTFTTFCKDGKFVIDMKSFMSPESMQTEDVQLQFEASDMEIPSSLKAGQKLPDAWLKVSMQMEGMPMMNVQTINIINRIVEGFESMTTPAGTFECVKMSQETEIKSMFSMKMKSVTWYSLNVGMVRSETFDSKGKPLGYSVLTAFSSK